MSKRPGLCVVMAGAVALAALGLAGFTGHAWEDWFITLRASKNLAEGYGPVFTPGERVHSFTSPLGMLIPGLLYLVFRDPDLTLWAFRVVSAGALACAVLLLCRVAVRGTRSRLAWIIAPLFVMVDFKTLDFTINGMETAFVLLGLAGLLFQLSHRPRPLYLGMWLAYLQWVRPDAFIFAGSLLAAHWVLMRGDESAGVWGKRFAIAAAWAGLMYLPWLAFATFYYGSPIPHTITAKGLSDNGMGTRFLMGLWNMPRESLFGGACSVPSVFMPPYAGFGGWPAVLQELARVFALVAALAWLLPGVGRATRVWAFGAFAGHVYLTSFVMLFPWYFPPVAMLSGLAWAGIVDSLWMVARRWRDVAVLRLARFGLVASVACVFLGYGTLTACAGLEIRAQQQLIETGLRHEIGLWLAKNAQSPRDTVFLECLGYIGYYSNLKMYDFPGLCAPEVVAVRRGSGNCFAGRAFADILLHLKPTWAVLRPVEAETIRFFNPDLIEKEYRLVRTFDNSIAVSRLPWYFFGRNYLHVDQTFQVYRRVDERDVAGEIGKPGLVQSMDSGGGVRGWLLGCLAL